ncbi:NADAR family protein [Streptomyces sp. NPDC002886]|uniref:NADAR family protein n=1 Tax=Streptomyces sp. NPDC002886 TaxID=3364667 RepID=UPI0036BB98CB
MIGNRVTHRVVDGVRIPGTWRPAFIRNGHHHLIDLFIYADGLIGCWELVTVEEFEEKLRTGWVATTVPEGAVAAAPGMGEWKFSEPRHWTAPDELVAEIRDTIDQLNDRPDSTARCLAAVDVFLADRTEENRAAARTAFLAVPKSQRHWALDDWDTKAWQLRVLVAGPGGHTYMFPREPAVTQERYDEALAYFEERARRRDEPKARVPAAGPAVVYAPAVRLHPTLSPKRVADPGRLGLRNEYPAPVTIGNVTHASVTHAYWALSIAEPAVREAIAAADTYNKARMLAREARLRDGWEQARTGFMTRLLRAKYDQHPELAEILLGTDDATLVYNDVDCDSAFWGDNSGRGRNWTGRLLELVRSELHMRRAGFPGL